MIKQIDAGKIKKPVQSFTIHKNRIQTNLIARLATICLLASYAVAFSPIYRSRERHYCTHSSSLFASSEGFQSSTDSPQKQSFGQISSETIEEIKTYADIVTVIESYDLPFFSRSSDGYRAKCICPFHSDRNPSLNIDNSRGIYKCFSCGAGGDVFNFVREYDFITKNGKGQKMSYPAAIQNVATEFCGGAVALKVQSTLTKGSYDKTMTPEKKEKLDQQRKKKERILLANSAAADFYAKSLITNPTAGIGRSHLYERGITPAMVRTFALGYAPDVYFGKASGSRTSKDAWGKGSLVERLEELKFSPQEILDAGLATVTAKARSRLQMTNTGTFLDESIVSSIIASTNDGNVTKSEQPRDRIRNRRSPQSEELEYSDLMDRFRGRVMVPIFDPSGKNVVGFGGRYLEAMNTGDAKEIPQQSFVAAKYLNTPDTPVFSKKNVLFGSHSASVAVDERDQRSPLLNTHGLAMQSEIPTIVIVEGYFDAITLYGAGVKEVAASMGTALTTSQLNMAVSTIGGRGRIILCLDNDEAGLNAVERICTSSSIWEFLEINGVEIEVASLPAGIKDPAEFIEVNGGAGESSSGNAFRTKVLKETMPWNDWFVMRLISRYDCSDSASFSSVCDSVSTFLSAHPNPGDRTKRAYEAAGKLAELISKERGSSSDGPLRIQLESDLLGMASRKASAREALTRRVEAADGDSGSKGKLARLNSGEATTRDDPQSSASLVESMKQDGIKQSTKARFERPHQGKIESGNGSNAIGKRYSKQREAPPMIQHFQGFQFSETDAEWLGLTTEKVRFGLNCSNVLVITSISRSSQFVHQGRKNFILGSPDDDIDDGDNYYRKQRYNNKDLVYFNSNDYIGNEKSVLSTIANMDGPTAPAVGQISNPLVKPDENKLLLDAESRLLHTMVIYASARLAMKSALANRIGGGKAFLEWSSLDREWLFQCLTDSPGHETLPRELQDGGTVAQLKAHLSSRPDTPVGAFGSDSLSVPNDERPAGSELSSASPNDVDGGVDREIPAKIIEAQNADRKEESMRFDTQELEGDVYGRGEERIENPGAMSKRGTLDFFFEEDEEHSGLELREGSASHEERAELTVQESVAIMLKATAIRRLTKVKDEWKCANEEQQRREFLNCQDQDKEDEDQLAQTNENQGSIYDALNDDELGQTCRVLGQKVVESMTTARDLTESASQLNKRLLDYCAADGVEGRLNSKRQEELAKALDEHLASLPDDPRPTESGASDDYVFGTDEYDNKIDPRFGGERSKKAPPPTKKKSRTVEQANGETMEVYDSIFE